MDNSTNPLYTDETQLVDNTLSFDDYNTTVSDPLDLKIPDDELIDIIDQRVKASSRFWEEKYNLSARRAKNEKYLFSRQLQDREKRGELKDYETRSADNVLYEIEASLKPLAMSKLPDTIVTPGGEDPERVESAKNLTVVIDDLNKKREQRSILGLAFKHLPVYFTAILKARWNPELGTDGDSEFVIVHPEYVIVDHTATSRNPDDMGFIAQCTPMTVQEVFMRFPKKKREFMDELKKNGVTLDESISYKALATEVKVWEIHFDWYKKKDSEELINREEMRSVSILEPGIEWEKVAGVIWKYEDCILLKMKDPNFDLEGEEKLFIYGTPGDETTKQEVDPQELFMASMMGIPMPDVLRERVYHNYFKRPHKPYFFMGYDQWAKVYIDETSRIEQNIRNQENLDDQNKTMLDQLKTRVKHIWSRDSGLSRGDIQRMDMDDPKMDALVEGNVNDVHKAIEPERPDAAQFNALGDTRARAYSIAGATAVRGQLQSDTATTNQIAREADFTRSDDLVEDTINPACEWMAQWRMQFIKLRYTNEHMKEILGSKGETTYIRLRRDSVSDGMEVLIKASSTDKLKAQRNAMETAKMGAPFTNPIDFFKDMDMADPEGRTERGMLFALDPNGYFAKYVMGLENPQEIALALTAGTPQQGAPQEGQPQQGAPQQPTPGDTSNVPSEPTAQPVEGSPRML